MRPKSKCAIYLCQVRKFSYLEQFGMGDAHLCTLYAYIEGSADETLYVFPIENHPSVAPILHALFLSHIWRVGLLLKT